MADIGADIVLASASKARAALLRNAGIAFRVRPASVDEREIERRLVADGAAPAMIAGGLADAKASAVSADAPDALTIGADQVLAFAGQRLHKPADRAAARGQLLALAGGTHALHSAVSVARRGAVIRRHGESAALTMRRLSGEAIDAYLAEAGEPALASVGAYQIEGPGIRLFERIEGDYFTILGLPLLPLLAFLRGERAIR